MDGSARVGSYTHHGFFQPVFVPRRGVTWTPIGAPTGFTTAAAFDPHHAGGIYVAVGAGVLGRLYLTPDGGKTWTEKASPPARFSAIQNLLVDPEVTETLYASTFDGFFVSRNGGVTWTATELPQANNGYSRFRMAHLSRSCGPGGGLLALSNVQNVIRSLDFGVTWRVSQSGPARDVAAGPGCAAYVLRPLTSDVFVAKLAPGGDEVLWATYLGGADRDAARAIALDGSGNLYIAGVTASSDFPGALARIDEKSRFATSAFAARFDPDGNLVYSVVLGGENTDDLRGLAVDRHGNAYLAGGTTSRRLPVTAGAFQEQFGGDSDAFVAKLGPDGALLYASFLGTDGAGYATSVTVDDMDQAIVGGSTSSANFPVTAGAMRSEKSDGGFVARFNPSESRLSYASYVGGTAGATYSGLGVFGAATDADGNVYLAGSIASDDFPVTGYMSPMRSVFCPSASRLFPGTPAGDAYVMKLRAGDFQPVYSALLGADCQSRPGALQIDAHSTVILPLLTSSGFPLVNPLVAEPGCANNAPGVGAIAQLSADGSSLQFSTYLNMCVAPAIAAAPDGSLYASTTPDGHASVLRIPVVR